MINFFKKIIFCIDKKDQKKIIYVSILIFINSLIELLSIGIFIPLIQILIDPDNYRFYKLIEYFTHFNFISSKNLSIFLIGIVVIIFIFRFFFQIFYFFIIQKYQHNVRLNLSRNLISKYINQPFNTSNQSTPTKMFKDIFTEVGIVVSNFSILLRLVSDLFLSLGILSLMVIFNPKVSISSFLIFFFIYLFYIFSFRNKLDELGKKRSKHNQKLISSVFESFNSLREIKLFDLKDFFIQKIIHHKDVDGWSKVKYILLRQVPIYFIELIIVIFFSIVIVFALKSGLNSKELLIQIGFYFICILRIIPILNKVSEYYQSYKFSKLPIEKIFNELQNIKQNKNKNQNNYFVKASNIIFKKKIVFKNLKFFYNLNKSFCLTIEDFVIHKNEYLGIIGSSGSGKSTFVDLLAGIIEPQYGGVYCDNVNINTNLNSWKKKIGFVPQAPYLYNDTIQNNICLTDKFNSVNINRDYFESVLRQCSLEDLYFNFKNKTIGESGSNISGGQKQRIAIARALYKNSEILILDEINFLDEKNQNQIISLINNLKKITIIFISHNKENLKYADRIVEIKDGKLIRK